MSFFHIEISSFDTNKIPDFLKDKYKPFFLDSGKYYKRIGRYSYFGFEPKLFFSFKDNKIFLNKDEIIEQPFVFLKKFLKKYLVKKENKIFPFQGGFVGFFSYELGKYIEKLPDNRIDDYNLPEYYLALYDVIYVIDMENDKFYIAGYEFDNNSLAKANYFKEQLKKISTKKEKFKIGSKISSNFTKIEYKNIIEKAKEYIFSGDIYQVNLSQRFNTDFYGCPSDFYKIFRQLSPAPFGAFLDYGDFQILSNSPERYLLISGNHIETRPIKGTRPRGLTKKDDLRYINDLKNSEKDKAEHLMIVDLERNDLGRIAKFNSVKVSEFEIIETYANVHHMVSTVEAKIDPKFDVVDCIINSYPGGSITGAPKIRSMEIIDELEPTYRSVYTGAIGYISLDGDIDLNIAIRTAIIKDNNIFFQVGGGIVADSEPEDEYNETIIKAESFTKTLKEI